MSGTLLLALSAVVLLGAYLTYGAWLAKKWGIDPNRKTPAQEMNDGIDYVPTNSAVLLGHHFSSIAGAGPIVGPITAAVFGWVPVVLWILVGSIFFGGVQDYGSLVASIRHRGQSIGQIIEATIGRRGKLLFSIFAWVTLLVVVAAFANIVASTFAASPAAGTSSMLFIALAVVFGILIYRVRLNLGVATVLGVAAMIGCMALGHMYPLVLSKNVWLVITIIYIGIASVTPVWVLLQPRDYLNSFLLYAMIFFAFIGIIVYSPSLNIAPVTAFDLGNMNWLFPMLFVTVACGAISGFHSLVGSGTSSKQIAKETDAKIVGYGAMLLEGFLAIIAVISVGFVATSPENLLEVLKAKGPVAIFAQANGRFMEAIGIPYAIGSEFVALTISAFALTSLDTATRLGRFLLQELFTSEEEAQTGAKPKSILANPYAATAVKLVCSAYLAVGSYLAIWPIFGTANQLLAAMALLAIAVWLKQCGYENRMVLYPMVFMFIVTFTALSQLIILYFSRGNYLVGTMAAVLFALAVALVVLSVRTIKKAVAR
ncbi:MAG: carbon starvation protein A [Duodenibacillus sp.]|nr:carbon starvation protein A [Duodenibacillus sp.]